MVGRLVMGRLVTGRLAMGRFGCDILWFSSFGTFGGTTIYLSKALSDCPYVWLPFTNDVLVPLLKLCRKCFSEVGAFCSINFRVYPISIAFQLFSKKIHTC